MAKNTRGRKSHNNLIQGYYDPINPHKYKGKGRPFYRSSWEKRCFYFMDHNRNVIEWASESIIIPYVFSLDGKVHKYYPDIVCKIQTKEGIITYILEIKPYWQTIEPSKPKNRSTSRKKRYENEMFTYIKNRDKWEATQEFCNREGYEFKLLTEKELFNTET